MAKTYRHNLMRKLLARIVTRNVHKGKGRPDWYLLTTTGRRTGRRHELPVTLVERDGSRSLVAAYGMVGWVHNVRAEPAVSIERVGTVEEVVATEVEPSEAGPVLASYYDELKRFVAPYWDVPREGATADDFVAAAAAHPVFRLEPVG